MTYSLQENLNPLLGVEEFRLSTSTRGVDSRVSLHDRAVLVISNPSTAPRKGYPQGIQLQSKSALVHPLSDRARPLCGFPSSEDGNSLESWMLPPGFQQRFFGRCPKLERSLRRSSNMANGQNFLCSSFYKLGVLLVGVLRISGSRLGPLSFTVIILKRKEKQNPRARGGNWQHNLPSITDSPCLC